MTHRPPDRKGFTLVEVIVISLIVALLAIIGISIYISYVKDAATHVAQNVAGSAASYLSSAHNASTNWSDPPVLDGTDGSSANDTWTYIVGNNDTVTWTCPPNAIVNIISGENKLNVTVKNGYIERTSVDYDF